MAVYRHTAGTIAKKSITQFYNDVISGLQSTPKRLQSKYFYDAEGDALFQQIMHCPEYYLTGCEMEIFSQQTEQLTQAFLQEYNEFDVVELGAGDASKSVHLLRSLLQAGADFTYFPIDISGNVIQMLEKSLPQQVNGIRVKGLQGDYIDMIHEANLLSKKRKLVLFLGSNIGNFSPPDALLFLTSLQKSLRPGDLVLVGFDLKKDPSKILAAYNDKQGITKAFNLNLLTRINEEMGADFDLNQFKHYPVYHPVSGACESYLISLQDQVVTIADTEEILFQKHEPIYMELSQKYSPEETDAMATQTGFKPVHYFFDSNEWFLDAVWEKR